MALNDLEYRPELYPNWEKVEELIEADYSWSAVGVFRNKIENTYFYATDSGCSCYGPWESTQPEDLTPLTVENFPEFKKAVEGLVEEDTVKAAYLHRMQQAANIYPGVTSV